MTTFLRNAGMFVGTKPKWVPERDMPDQTGRVIVVTGATAGLGYETCRQLLAKGATVYATGRSEEKANATVEKLKAEPTHKGEVHPIILDLSDLASIRKGAEDLLSKTPKIDALIANAGVMILGNAAVSKDLTKQGHEIQFGTNVLGHHFLIKLLRPALIKAAESGKPGSVRIVLVSSSGHFLLPSKKLLKNWDPSDQAGKEYSPSVLYGRSKLGNLHTTQKLVDELSDKGIVSVGLHPGNIRTELQRHASAVERYVIGAMLYPVELGANSQLFAATADEDSKKLNGAYLVPWSTYSNMSPAASDKALIDKTWQWCEEQSKDF